MKVIVIPEVYDFLENLVIILYEKEYFGFEDAARKYVDQKKQTYFMVRIFQIIRGKRRTDISNSIHRKQPHSGTAFIVSKFR